MLAWFGLYANSPHDISVSAKTILLQIFFFVFEIITMNTCYT